MSSPAKQARPTDARAAALAAAEARLKPIISPSTSDSGAASTGPSGTSGISGTSGTSTPSGLFSGARGPNVKRWEPTEKEDRETRLKFSRLLDRGIVRDNGYKDAAVCAETLLLIANNIIQHNEPKYRDIKATNGMLQNKVLSAKGGHDYLIALGFRTQSIDFTQHYILQPSLKKMHDLGIGADVLSDHLSMLQSRAAQAASSKVYASADDESRKAKALREIEADRDSVKDRLARDKRMRERAERIAREKEDQLKREEEERARMGMVGGMEGLGEDGSLPGGLTLGSTGGMDAHVPAGSMGMELEDEGVEDDSEEEDGDEMSGLNTGGRRLGD